MKLNLTDPQIRKARKGLTFQVAKAQMGSGINYNLHPANIKKIQNAYRQGKGARLTLTGTELGYAEDEDEMDGAGLFKKIKKSANKSVGKVNKLAKKHITEKNVAKYSLKGYNRINKELEKKGLDSIHGAILNEGLGYVPFVPQTAKDIASSYAEKAIDKKLDSESRRVGAGFKKSIARPARNLVKKKMTKGNLKKALNKGNQIAKDLGYHNDIQTMVAKKIAPRQKNVQNVLTDEFNAFSGSGVNPYLPTGLIKGSGVKPISSGKKRVFNDQHNILRKGQAGFVGQSRQQAEREAIYGGSFKVLGGSFKV